MNVKSTFLFLAIFFIGTPLMTAQELKFPSLDKSPMDAVTYPRNAAWRNYLQGDDKNTPLQVRVRYCRPKKNEREIFGGLVPYGELWRLGANEATEVYFAAPVEIGGTFINAGYYTMFAEVYPSHWNIIISSETNIAGTANRDESKDVVSVKTPVTNVADSRESFTIGFQRVDDESCNMVFEWDRTRTALPISFNPAYLGGDDASPMDLVQYPSNSRFLNFIENADERAAAAPKIRVVYSRPQKKDRVIFGELIKYGEPWRIGANETTEITFYGDVKVGDTDVKSGTYGMMAIVNADKWDIVIHKNIPSWGTFGHDDEKNVATVSVPVQKTPSTVEELSILLEKKDDNSAEMIIAWDNSMVKVPVMFK